MGSETLVILLVVVLIAVVFLIRWGMNAAVNKGADAVDNAIRKKHAESSPSQPENLADRFKNTKQ